MKKYLNYLITLRYTKIISYISAKYLQITREESHKHKYTYYYGFQIIYGAINKGLLLITLGLLLNILPQILLVTISFAALRVWAGGLHFNSYTKCAYISLFGFATMALLAKYIHLSQTTSIIIFLLVFIIFLIYAPVEHPNRPLKDNEKIKFKLITITILTFFFVRNLLDLDGIIITNSIVFGTLLAGLIATPIINRLE